MMRRNNFDDALFLLALLAKRQRALGLSDMDMERLTDMSHSCFEKWRRGRRTATFKGVIAYARALGLEIVIKERSAPTITRAAGNRSTLESRSALDERRMAGHSR